MSSIFYRYRPPTRTTDDNNIKLRQLLKKRCSVVWWGGAVPLPIKFSNFIPGNAGAFY